MATHTTNKNWHKSEASDTYQTTRTDINTTLDSIDTLLKNIYSSESSVGVGIASPVARLDLGTLGGSINTPYKYLFGRAASDTWPLSVECIWDNSYADQYIILNGKLDGGTRASPTATSTATASFIRHIAVPSRLDIGNITTGTGSALTPRMSILASGSVGIGTLTPQSLLDIRGAAGYPGKITLASDELTVVDGDVLGEIDFNAPVESSGTDAILLAAAIKAIAEGDFTTTSNATELCFFTGSSEAATQKMTLTSSGKLGIGEAAPTARLDLGVLSGSYDTEVKAFYFAGANTDWPFKLSMLWDASYLDHYILFNALIDGGSRASPTFWANGTGGSYIRNTSAGRLDLGRIAGGSGVSPTNAISILVTGAVGINTTGQAAKLAVNGGLNVGADSDPGDNNLYVVGDCSALTFTDRTPAYVGDALSDIKKIKPDRSGLIDHDILPAFLKSTYREPIYEEVDVENEIKGIGVDGKPTKIKRIVKEKRSDRYTEKPGRNLGNAVSMLMVAVQQLTDLVESQSKEISDLKKKIGA